MKPRYLVYCLLIVVFGCTENNNPPNNQGQDTCYYDPMSSYDNPWQTGSTTWQTRAYNFTKPCFNPSNSDEFVYIRYEQEWLENGNYELRKHTMSTNQDMVLCPVNAKTSLMSWNNMGWIYFCDNNNNVWRIQEDGTQLTQFTFCGGMFRPNTNSSGNYIVIEQLNFGPNTQTVVLDNYGAFIDTIADKYVANTWLNDSTLFIIYPLPANKNLWKLMSYPSKQVLATDTFPLNTKLLESPGNNQILYSDGYSLYMYDMIGINYTLLKEYCGYRYSYRAFSYSPVTQRILIEREWVKPIDIENHIYYIQNDIMLMDSDGSHEEVLTLPQNP